MFGFWLTMWAPLLLLIIISVPSQGIRKGKPCELPAEWEGRWFEYGEREAISVSKRNVTHKGVCKFMDNNDYGDKYIFFEKKNQCYRCAMMYQKHENVLQYRESSLCEKQLDFRNYFRLCDTIRADEQIKSMFRLEGKAIDCPLTVNSNPPNPGGKNTNTAFQLTYSRGHGSCDWPVSSMSQCSDKSKMIFRYQACADIKGSESIVEEVSCVAKWKEGSTFYFLGLLNNSHVQPDDYERRFRCFAYSKFFQGYHVAQSGDAECNLPNSKEGDRTMVLKQEKSHQNRCNLPSWMLKHHQYHNLNETTHYHFNKRGTSITITESTDNEEGIMASKTLKCNTIEEDTGTYSRMIMQVNFECESGYMCLEVNYRSENVISAKIGRLSRNREEACDRQLFFDTSIQSTTLISAKHKHERCPLVGKYSISSLNLPHHNNPGLSSRNRKWTHEPTPIKSPSLIDNDCASTFLADDEEVHSQTEPSFSSSNNAKSYLMFGCAGESKFRLLNSCAKLSKPMGGRNGFSSDKNNQGRDSVISSPLTTSNKLNGYRDSSFRENHASMETTQEIIEGYTCHGGWREPLDDTAPPSSTNQGRIRSHNRKNKQQNYKHHFQDNTELSQKLYSSNYQQLLQHKSQPSRSLEVRKEKIRSRDDQRMMNQNINMDEMGDLGANEEGEASQQQHLSSYVQYLIVSPLMTKETSSSDKIPHLRKRLCARIIVQNPVELSFVTLVADEDECPTRDDITNDIRGSRTGHSYNIDNSRSSWSNGNQFSRRKTKWRFNLTRTSECAQALATANSSSKTSPFLQQINFSKASIILLGVILYTLLVQN